jgi:fused signal recognition particle receptor
MLEFFTKMKESLSKTRGQLICSLQSIFHFGKITNEMIDEVEEVLYQADLGPHAVEKLVEELRNHAGEINSKETDPFMVMKKGVLSVIDRFEDTRVTVKKDRPQIILVIGVNGSGKTTTIGKLALRFRKEGYSVLLAACDTFRAAAVEQLGIWTERAGAELVKAHFGADAASVAYDAVMRAKARATDLVIIDTAGRLHTSKNLMEELKKIHKVLGKAMESAPHETLLVLDATNGQNALRQAEMFSRELPVTGIVLTKLDGTAKGGIVVSIIDKLGIPIKLIGIGEGVDDLRDFNPSEFTEALFSNSLDSKQFFS